MNNLKLPIKDFFLFNKRINEYYKYKYPLKIKIIEQNDDLLNNYVINKIFINYPIITGLNLPKVYYTKKNIKNITKSLIEMFDYIIIYNKTLKGVLDCKNTLLYQYNKNDLITSTLFKCHVIKDDHLLMILKEYETKESLLFIMLVDILQNPFSFFVLYNYDYKNYIIEDKELLLAFNILPLLDKTKKNNSINSINSIILENQDPILLENLCKYNNTNALLYSIKRINIQDDFNMEEFKSYPFELTMDKKIYN